MARTIRMTALALAFASLSGCASVRWVDDATEGDLLGTGGRELGIVRVLGGPESEKAATEGGWGAEAAAVGAFLELLILSGSF